MSDFLFSTYTPRELPTVQSFKPGNNNQNSTLDKELVIVVNPIKEFMVLVLTIESTLLGAALGFYFGEKSGIKK
jgi:hypothetical protein